MILLEEEQSRLQDKGAVLVVEDDARVARSIERELSHDSVVLTCVSMAEALVALDAHRDRFIAALLDVRLPDGSGIQILEALRAASPELPVLVLTCVADHGVISRAQQLGAQFLLKPLGRSNLRAFLERARRPGEPPGRLLEQRVAALATRYRLSDRERLVLLLAARGVAPSSLHARMGISPNTAKTLIRRTLRKCDASSIGELVGPLQEEILSGDADARRFDGDQADGATPLAPG